jgi:antitoxin (DNA-binding transcriptional repressor) of toxin-antitoxin stability system
VREARRQERGEAMKFISVRELRSRSAEIWERLGAEKDMVVTSNGKPVAILSTVTEGNLEESLRAIRRARAEEAVLAMQTQSVKSGSNGLSLDDINAEIAASRKDRFR